MTVAQIAQKVLRVMDNNSPQILTGLAVGGVVSTIILTVRATMRTSTIISEEVLKRDDIVSTKEIVKLTWQEYIPVVGMGAVTITCILGAQSINSRRQAALITGFTLAETAFKEYREKVGEILGEKTDESIRDEVAKDRIQNNPPSNQVVITGRGDVLCYDMFSGHYFMCDMEILRKSQNDINAQCINGGYASQNEFYQLIGLPRTRYGEEFGWTTENLLDLTFVAKLTEENTPCIAIDYRTQPVRNYYKFH